MENNEIQILIEKRILMPKDSQFNLFLIIFVISLRPVLDCTIRLYYDKKNPFFACEQIKMKKINFATKKKINFICLPDIRKFIFVVDKNSSSNMAYIYAFAIGISNVIAYVHCNSILLHTKKKQTFFWPIL